MDQFPCLGFDVFGSCAYDPRKPASIYFDIGGAIAALGFALAIQQLIKPIFVFRLRAYRIEFWHLVLAIFAGFLAVIVATLLPSLPISQLRPWSYPVVWEVAAALVIAGAYAFAALLILRPVKVTSFNLISFVRAAATMLANAKDEDRVAFVADIAANVEIIFRHAMAWELADRHAVEIEFSRLRETGQPMTIHGQPRVSAFYLFTHRRALEQGGYAVTLLRLMADQRFCGALVQDCPWHTADIINIVSEQRLYVPQAANFIQQLASQAIHSETSMMARESGYDGFADVPRLSMSLFSSPFILRSYRPLNSLSFGIREPINVGYIRRLNAASKMMLEVALVHHGWWDISYMFDVQTAYASVSRKMGWSKKTAAEEGYPDIEWHSGVRDLYNMVLEKFETILPRQVEALFSPRDQQHSRTNVVELIAEIAYESLEAIGGSFDGPDGRYWSHAIGTFMDLFPRHGNEVAGMNPLQQRIAIKLIEKLRQNLEGWYPAISRVLLSVIGPYEQGDSVHSRIRTADAILRDAVYGELHKLKDLYAAKPDKFGEFLPGNVTYDSASDSLTHRFVMGESKVTHLATLHPPIVDLFDSSNWSQLGSGS